MPFSPATLYYTAALLHAATIPKHALVGINKIAPASATITGEQHAVTKKLITPTWLHANVFLATFGRQDLCSSVLLVRAQTARH